jgi:hypothetical protein
VRSLAASALGGERVFRKKPGVVVADAVHACRCWQRRHQFGWVRLKEREGVLLRDRRVEPDTLGPGRKDHRHPVMHRSHQLVRRRGDDRAALQDLSGRFVRPGSPEASEREQLVLGQVEVDRVLLAVAPGARLFASGSMAAWRLAEVPRCVPPPLARTPRRACPREGHCCASCAPVRATLRRFQAALSGSGLGASLLPSVLTDARGLSIRAGARRASGLTSSRASGLTAPCGRHELCAKIGMRARRVRPRGVLPNRQAGGRQTCGGSFGWRLWSRSPSGF